MLKRYIAFERLLKLKTNVRGCKIILQRVYLPTLRYEEAGTKHPHKRKFNFDNFYPKYKRLQFAQTYFAGKAEWKYVWAIQNLLYFEQKLSKLNFLLSGYLLPASPQLGVGRMFLKWFYSLLCLFQVSKATQTLYSVWVAKI